MTLYHMSCFLRIVGKIGSVVTASRATELLGCHDSLGAEVAETSYSYIILGSFIHNVGPLTVSTNI